MHISYIYIKSYRVLNNIGLSFDHRFSFIIEDGVLHISRNNSVPTNFWQNGIYSFTAIIGNNGCGKTTALQLLKMLLVNGEPRNVDVEALIIYENDDRLFIFNPIGISIDAADNNIVYTTISERISIETLYYTGHFRPYDSLEDIELSGSYEASDGWLLVKDLQDYSNIDTLHLTEPILDHIQAYNAQNNYRICELLLLEGLNKVMKSVRLPRYVLFAPNKGGWNAIRKKMANSIIIPAEKTTSKNVRGKALEQFIYYNILNYIAEGKSDSNELIAFLDYWIKQSKQDGVVKTLNSCIANSAISDKTKLVLRTLSFVIEKLDDLCKYNQYNNAFYINIQSKADNLRSFLNEINQSQFYLTAKFFDVFFSHSKMGGTRLSSGEQELFNLLSRLYYGITVMPQKFGNKYAPTLLLLDEAEIGFHPDWQRQYVLILTEFMRYMRVRAGMDFQIVITSHSPIILSDLPSYCVNFLRKQENGSTQLIKEKETFGENIFNLYRRAFFMENGLIGEFASKKLNEVMKEVETGKVSENTRKTIKLLGDERIKRYFENKLNERDIDSEVQYHEEMIRKLKSKKLNPDE